MSRFTCRQLFSNSFHSIWLIWWSMVLGWWNGICSEVQYRTMRSWVQFFRPAVVLPLLKLCTLSMGIPPTQPHQLQAARSVQWYQWMIPLESHWTAVWCTAFACVLSPQLSKPRPSSKKETNISRVGNMSRQSSAIQKPLSYAHQKTSKT